MKDYVILTDSTADLPTEVIDEFKIGVIPLKFSLDEKVYTKNDISPGEFYARVREKCIVTTSQANLSEFKDFFQKYLENDCDIVYVGFSSGLSGTVHSARIAADELSEAFPNNRIEIIDSLSASLGEGMLVYNMAHKKQEGSTVDELVKWAKENITKTCHWFIVDDLYHLRRGGRISQASAVMGSVLGIKPILNVDDFGKLSCVGKARGRQKAIETLISKMEESSINPAEQTVFISHADCLEDAENLAEKVKKKFGVKKIIINSIGPVIGSHAGAGALALFFTGEKR